MINNIKSKFIKGKGTKKKGYNPSFLSAIQPQGGVAFKEKVVNKGDGYETVIHIYDYPTDVEDFWLEPIVNMHDVIATVDIATEQRSKSISHLNESLTEKFDQMTGDKDTSGRIAARSEFNDLENLYSQISQNGEVVKIVHIRLYVHSKTSAGLEQKVKEILEDLEGSSFLGSVFLNEAEYEWKSLHLPYKDQMKLMNKREGKEMAATTLAGGFPFNFTDLQDPYGTYFGTTFTGGNVLFDLFHKDKKRRYYNAVVVGTMGAGKSTLLKKIFLDNVCRGNMLRGFDITGEFTDLVQDVNGRILVMDGSEGILNPLQVLKTDEKEHQSFMLHLSKLSMFYRFLSPNATDETIKEFEKVLRGIYEKFGLIDKLETTGITNLKSGDYPIFSDLLTYIRNELFSDYDKKVIRTELSKGRVTRLESIELTIENLVENYGYLFNGHSSIENINDEQVVFFSLRSLTSMKSEIFNAQLFNLLMLCWDNMLQNGQPQKDAFEEGTLDFEDVRRFLIIIDESHRIINPENLLAVKQLTTFEREARKYFAGLIFASQSIRDYVPENADSEAVAEIKKLFELTQYKFIMQQDANSLEAMKQIFSGQITESELNSIPLLEEGETVLAINSLRNISFKIDADPEELKLFRGGA